MLDSASGRPCDPLALEFNKTTGEYLELFHDDAPSNCFTSVFEFIFKQSGTLSEWFIRIIFYCFRWAVQPWPELRFGADLPLFRFLHLPLFIHHAQPLRSSHHGQLWLPHQVWITNTPKFLPDLWPLSQQQSLICLEGKSIAPQQDTVLFQSFQWLPSPNPLKKRAF